jgi:hypothetical protein
VRDPSGWSCTAQGGTFDLDELRRSADDPLIPKKTRQVLFSKTFYKTRWASLRDPKTDEELKQNLICTFSLK